MTQHNYSMGLRGEQVPSRHGRKCVAILLILAGVALMALASFVRAHDKSRGQSAGRASLPESAGAPASSVATSVVSGRVMRLGPTAAAAATRLPPATLIATAGPVSIRPSAALRIVVPAVGIDARVVDVGWRAVHQDGQARGVWDTVAGAAGHHRGSADPGQPGNCVLSAHSSDAGGAVFRRLGELVSGELVELYTVDGRRCEYVVSSVLTLDEVGATEAEKREHARWLDPTDEPVLTLVTCWPAWSYTHRIVVRAKLRVP